VLLWRNFHLGKLDAGLTGACVCRFREAFRFMAGSQCEWLTPGRSFSSPTGRVVVEPFDHAVG
jgi:hypothetical protein